MRKYKVIFLVLLHTITHSGTKQLSWSLGCIQVSQMPQSLVADLQARLLKQQRKEEAALQHFTVKQMKKAFVCPAQVTTQPDLSFSCQGAGTRICCFCLSSAQFSSSQPAEHIMLIPTEVPTQSQRCFFQNLICNYRGKKAKTPTLTQSNSTL